MRRNGAIYPEIHESDHTHAHTHTTSFPNSPSQNTLGTLSKTFYQFAIVCVCARRKKRIAPAKTQHTSLKRNAAYGWTPRGQLTRFSPSRFF